MNTQIAFEQVVRRGCGMDVHRDTVVATVMGDGIKKETRTFNTYTNTLKQLSEWLQSHSVTHVAMESTGIYWRPVFNILEEHFQILLVNAQHVRNVPGHKTDKKDSVWLTKLLLSGLLKASFIPPKAIRQIRDLTRYRKKLSQQATAERNRFEKVLQDANFKMSNVISDIFGLTGSKLIEALLNDNTDFDYLFSLCHGRIKAKKDNLKEALVGNLTPHHKFMLRAIQQSIDDILIKMEGVNDQIDLLSRPFEAELQLLQTIPGINKVSAISLLAEIGIDMDKFPTALHLASWAGICPGNNESAGKKMSTRILQGNQYIKPILVECAWSVTHVKDCYLRGKYESLVGRRGKKRALIAVGHKIIIAIYYILKGKVPYNDLGYNYLIERKKKNQVQSYIDKLKNLGVNVQINNEI